MTLFLELITNIRPNTKTKCGRTKFCVAAVRGVWQEVGGV